MCNLFGQTSAKEAMRQVFPARPWEDLSGNLGPEEIYPDRQAAIVHADGPTMVLRMARWGLPSPPQYHSVSGIDRGVTNIRNLSSPHWRRWLGVEHRCLVPVDRFAEPRGAQKGNAWFALERPAFFAGIWVPDWLSLRKLKDGPTRDDLFAFLTCEANAEVRAVHPKAMPVILTAPDDWEKWLFAPWSDAAKLQRPLPDDTLVLVE